MSGIRITGFHLAPRKTAARRVTLSNLWRRSFLKELDSCRRSLNALRNPVRRSFLSPSPNRWYVGLSDLFTFALVAFGSDIEVVAAP